MAHKVNNHSRTTLVNSASSAAERFDAANKRHDPPTVLNTAEREVFDYLMAGRSYDDWTPADLLIAARAAQAEALIRVGHAQLAEMPAIEQLLLDTDAYNLTAAIDKMTKQLLTLLRAIGFTRTPIKDTGVAAATRAREERQIRAAGDDDEASMIALN